MTRLALMLVCLLLARVGSAQVNTTEWNSEGTKSAPIAASTTLCQFQNLNPSAETHNIHFKVVADVAAMVFLEHMDATNTSPLPGPVAPRSDITPLQARLPFESMRFFVTLDTNERIRVRTGSLIAAGNIQCTMFVE